MARLDLELVHRGLARSRTHAAKLIASGAVRVAGAAAGRPSQPVDEHVDISVAATEHDRYVSRAGHKLAGALAAFGGVDPRGRRCLDAGASTGGFTDVLLQAGAAEVVAVDVGHGQLVDALRHDARVRVHEGLNVRDLGPDQIGGPAALTVADLSFISLTLVVAALAACTEAGGDLVLMVKPQFEVGRERLARTGVVSSDGERRRAVAAVAEAAAREGLALRGLARSPLPGQDGNLEYFLWLARPADRAAGTDGHSEPPGQEPAEWVAAHWPATDPQEASA
ncbi:23S rRNA (cytidine1920-2'-O)/16S rRNA (cytidine1409-2'-O)-methyltransferase [Sinomonas atrocyanea]|uniref:TlyA family RNA methyltransferase n=1 Tax=Sinomonas atrocyanea TaxID=37927 RepID=UPI0027830951|nr:TlyA family RNA methyltransferase [Sinomonas atrocyanea]MDP9885231.1 23S rRNA (cytidine1920-2'-O)/16S rRNA (cytidine1409-2'-O)-methyltransferase [Sinomonas atrocyanea]